MKVIHPIQLKILKKLLFAESLRYSELKPSEEMENNQFDFHLDQMVKEGHIQKSANKYQLTIKGKEFANRMDTDSLVMMKQAKVSVSVCCLKQISGEQNYLFYTRLKQPFYGCQGFPAGKVAYGETIIEAAKREMKEETNLEGAPEIITLKHYRVINKETNELMEDKFMFICIMKEPTGELIGNEEGQYQWVPKKDIFEFVKNPFESLEDTRSILKEIDNFKGQVTIEEIDHISNNF